MLVTGCTFRQYVDPNEPVPGKILPATVLRRNFEDMHWKLEKRVSTGELTRPEKEAYVKTFADKALKGITLNGIPKAEAWAYADVMRQANRWEDAYALLKIAVSVATNDDRRVNDTLQLARVAAHLGKLDEAISLAKSTFNVAPPGKAPILFAVLYEIVPECEKSVAEKDRKTENVVLGQLVESAISESEATVVDANSESGKVFLAARNHHLQKAWDKVMKLYTASSRTDLARAALQKSEASFSKSSNL